MANLDLLLKDLTNKDEKKAIEAARYMIDNSDVELYKLLVEKSDFLFEFIRNNVCKRIEKVVSMDNFANILNFWSVYSPYYDDLFASILSKHATQDLTDEIFELLEKGTVEQKAYAAKYFSYIPDTIALEPLSKYAFSDDESLAYNAAEALGQMQDDISFDIALSNLSSDDDFEVLKAVKFFVAYGKNYPLKDIFDALEKSKMPENIAGQIPYMESLLVLLHNEHRQQALLTISSILNGLGEILPLSDIFQFELYEILENLIKTNSGENKNSGLIASVLLAALSRFTMFCENQEYIFDEDKDTKQEVLAIKDLLQSQNEEFWNMQKHFVISELNQDDNRKMLVLPIIAEFSLVEAIPDLKKLINSENEALVCELLTTLKTLNALNDIDINAVLERIKNPNIKAVIENLKT
ncbi:MAG: hypothetical protein IJY61_02415 [Candidatus Gastranaerophilales bacterium]|nr:hypothetical protein [Candidatus Gastranaerophilales bacterium]